MKSVFVIGGGGREHAIVEAIARGPNRPELIICAPGNPGIANLARCINIPADDVDRLVDWASTERPDLTIVGPEIPLVAGIVDRFTEIGLPIFGPSQAAARLEASKAYSYGTLSLIGDADFVPDSRIYFTAHDAMIGVEIDWEEAWEKGGVVVKADGLAAGKGVIMARTMDEANDAIRRIMVERVFGRAGDIVLIQEFVEGRELSALLLTDGKTVRWLGAAQDYKRLRDDNQGPNTGGMGAISPVPWVTDNLRGEIEEAIAQPLIRYMEQEGRPYRGLLYLGLMIEPNGHPTVLEVNCRFGDPETQAMLPALNSGNLLELLAATVHGRLAEIPEAALTNQRAVCITLAAAGYPNQSHIGDLISGIDHASTMPGVHLYHAGTFLRDGGTVLTTNGGRVLSVVGTGFTYREASERAYAAANLINFEGRQMRTDIGAEYIEGSLH